MEPTSLGPVSYTHLDVYKRQLVIALEGTGEVTIDGRKHSLQAGEAIVMPAKHPHAVFAPEQFKMFLVVVFPVKEGDAL